MAATRVQTVSGNEGGFVTTLTAVFATDVTSGNLIVIGFTRGAAITVSSISDTVGSTYNLIHDGAGPYGGGSWYYAVAAASGANTITVNFSGSTDPAYVAREYSGLTASPFDVSAEALDGSYITSHPTGTTATTAQSNELVVGFYAGDGNATYTASGLSNLVDENGFSIYHSCVLGDKDVTSVGTQSDTFTSSTSLNGWASIATFKEAAAAATATYVPQLLTLNVG